ncbi:hypothetical protein D3C85_1467250 [compost metagenome]
MQGQGDGQQHEQGMADQLLPQAGTAYQQAGAKQGNQGGQGQQAEVAFEQGEDVTEAEQRQADPLRGKHEKSFEKHNVNPSTALPRSETRLSAILWPLLLILRCLLHKAKARSPGTGPSLQAAINCRST